MRYTVQTEDGELTFESLAHLRQLYQKGLVSPGDKVRAEGSAVWRQAGAIPELRDAVDHRAEDRRWALWGLTVAVFLSAAFYAAVVYKSFLIAVILMVPVLGMIQRTIVRVNRRRRS